MRKIISCARNCEEQKGGHPRPSWGHPAPAAPGPTHHRARERRQRRRLPPHVGGQHSPQAPRAAPLRGVGCLRKRDGRAQAVLGGLHGAGSDAGRTCTWSGGRSGHCGDPPLAPPRPGAPRPSPTVTQRAVQASIWVAGKMSSYLPSKNEDVRDALSGPSHTQPTEGCGCS